MDNIPYVPHSFRHGGATHAYLSGSTVEQIKIRGRWKSLDSLNTYIQTARALFIDLDIPKQYNDLGHLLSPIMDQVIQLLMQHVNLVTSNNRW